MSTDTLTKTIFLNTDPATVWSYLTQKDKLGLWFFTAEADLQEGQDYTLGEPNQEGGLDKMCWGEIKLFEPPRKMVWSFTIAPLNGVMTTVTWTLETFQNGTRLTMVHEGIGAVAGDAALPLLGSLDAGWDRYFGKLRENVKELQTV